MSSKKGIIIIAIITIIILVGAGVGGYFLYQKMELDKPIEQEWGQTYYTYIKEEAKKEKDSNTTSTFNYNHEKAKIQFCNVEKVEKPVMVYQFTEGDKNFTNILYIGNDNNVNSSFTDAPSQVEYLYDIENQKYDWYLHTTLPNDSNTSTDEYTPIAEQINYNLQTSDNTPIPASITFNENDKTSVTDKDGTEHSIEKAKEKFIKTDVAEKNFTDFNINTDEKTLKNTIKNTVDNYKQTSELVTPEVVSDVEEKKKEVASKQEEIKKIEEENAQIQAEQEKERKKQEELEKGLQVGNSRLKYGTYKLDFPYDGLYGTIELKPDGQCHINSNCDIDSLNKTVCNQDTTYRVESNVELGLPGTYSDCIVFNMNGEDVYFEVYKDNFFSDQWHGYGLN